MLYEWIIYAYIESFSFLLFAGNGNLSLLEQRPSDSSNLCHPKMAVAVVSEFNIFGSRTSNLSPEQRLFILLLLTLCLFGKILFLFFETTFLE